MAKPGPGQSHIAAGIGSGPAGSGIETCSQLDLAGGTSIFSGSGAGPKLVNGAAPDVGDIWIRIDTPSTANQRIYICTVGGANPTWLGIV